MSGKRAIFGALALLFLVTFLVDLSDGKLGNRPRTGEPVDHVDHVVSAHVHHLDRGLMVELPPPSARPQYYLVTLILPKELYADAFYAGCHSSGGIPLSRPRLHARCPIFSFCMSIFMLTPVS